jgi:hypothetical protein
MTDPAELKDCLADLDGFLRSYRDLLNNEPRMLRPLREALDAGRVKYRDLPHRNGNGNGNGHHVTMK